LHLRAAAVADVLFDHGHLTKLLHTRIVMLKYRQGLRVLCKIDDAEKDIPEYVQYSPPVPSLQHSACMCGCDNDVCITSTIATSTTGLLDKSTHAHITSTLYARPSFCSSFSYPGQPVTLLQACVFQYRR
jgi:hypothetical protein